MERFGKKILEVGGDFKFGFGIGIGIGIGIGFEELVIILGSEMDIISASRVTHKEEEKKENCRK